MVITYWLLFILLFGVVVFIHELGHFLVAKKSGVFVERFALGFGPTLLKKKWGETEYAICAFPLGGYVKMRGEDPTDESVQGPESFLGAPIGRRIAIAVMGPTANLLLPVVVFTVLFMVGFPTLTSRLGWIIPGSPADVAGLRSGDVVETIDGRPVWKWDDMEKTIRGSAGRPLKLGVDRQGTKLDLAVTPQTAKSMNLFGEEEDAGRIGVSPQPLRPVVGLSDPKSPAAKAGLKTGDIVTAVNGRTTDEWWEFEKLLAGAKAPVTLDVERFEGSVDQAKKTRASVTLASAGTPASLGIDAGDLFVREIQADSVAERIGLKAGDRLAAVNNKPLPSWSDFQEIIRTNQGEPLTLGILREGKALKLRFTPEEVENRDEITKAKEKRRQLGVISAAVPGNVEQRRERYLNPFSALTHGVRTTGEMVGLTVVGLYKLVTGKLPVRRSLGGPISIFYLAGGSYEAGGWISFFRMMAVLSITLGVINLLPIPVLDGGHIFFFLIEAIKGKPVNLRVRELAQQAGLVLIIMLMALTFYVDIERYFVDHIKALFN